MKFTAAATTVLPFLITLSHPQNISARLSAHGIIDGSDEMENGKDKTRYLMWKNDSHQESLLDDTMKAKLANAKEHININKSNQENKLHRILPSKSKKGHDMVCLISKFLHRKSL